MLNIALIGATGKMGTKIAAHIAAKPDYYHLTNAVVNDIAKVKPELVQIADTIVDDIHLINPVDVVIDFSTPTASICSLEYCVTHQIPLVLGATGFTSQQLLLVEQASKDLAIFMTPNFSLSVNLLFKLTQLAASKLTNFEAEIIEAHHRYKKDAPSGTALKLGETIANARNIDFSTYAKFTRHGISEERHPQDIGFAVVRGGNIVGKHDVLFINDDETLTLSSEISNRGSFAEGSLIAAAFVATQQPGLYNMADVLDI